eukprot:superscaffoldBa00004108_g18292
MEVESVSLEDESRLTRLRFDAAVKVIKTLPPDGPFQPSNDMMLKFYSYYKQATVGACNIPRPGFWDAVGKAKWDAWNSLGDMPKEEAMAAYVDEMKLILEGMPMTDEVEELLRVLGPFYELVEEKKKITQISDLSTDLTVDVSGPVHLASDSDSEVYCDSSSEHNRSLDELDEEENHVLPPLDHDTHEDVVGPPQVIRSPGLGSGALVPMHGGGDGDGGNWGGAVTPAGSLNEQIVVALARLQEDMQSVLERLHTLEALTATQARSVALSPTYAAPPVNKKSQKPSWWPFDISPTSLAFAVIWPFVVQWLIRLYLQRRRRRIN